MKILRLTLKKKWFDMILRGEKKFEYRDIKRHFISRLMLCEVSIEWQCMDEIITDLKNVNLRHNGLDDLLSYFQVKFRDYDIIEFKNGYAKDAPKMKVEFCGIDVGRGNIEQGAPRRENVFIISLGDVVEKENINA